MLNRTLSLILGLLLKELIDKSLLFSLPQSFFIHVQEGGKLWPPPNPGSGGFGGTTGPGVEVRGPYFNFPIEKFDSVGKQTRKGRLYIIVILERFLYTELEGGNVTR